MNDPEPLFNQAVAHFRQRQMQPAQALLERLLASGARHLKAAELLGAICFQTGQPDKAAQAFALALSLQPGEPRNQLHFAIALNALKRGAEAEVVARELLQSQPRSYEAHFVLATALELQERIEEAAELARQGVACDPERPEGRLALARLQELGRHYASARETLTAALEMAPERAESWCDLARLHMTLGDLAACEAAARKAIELDPKLARAYRQLSEVRPCPGPDDTDLQAGLALATRDDLDDPARVEIHFALARQLDELGEHDRAFEHARSANRLHHQRFRFDLEAHRQWVDRLVATPPPAPAECAAPGPLLIVGMPRSGTTLLEQMLIQHPHIETAGELTWLDRWARGRRGSDGSTGPSDTETDRQDYLAQLQRAGSRNGAARYQIDKLPQNFVHLGELATLFPAAPVLHLRRRALDVCRSNYFTYFRDGNFWANDVDDLVGYYNEYRRLMDHWTEHPPVPLLNLDYEALVSDPRSVIERVLAFLDLDWNEDCLSHHRGRQAVYTASAGQVREAVHARAVGRAEPYRTRFPGLKDD